MAKRLDTKGETFLDFMKTAGPKETFTVYDRQGVMVLYEANMSREAPDVRKASRSVRINSNTLISPALANARLTEALVENGQVYLTADAKDDGSLVSIG
jgi:hypothetical protein